MKKILLIICLILLTGCKTQEEIKEEKRQEEINKVKNEVNNTEVPESTKDWLIKTKTEDVLTILCITTSNKCNTLKNNIENLSKANNILVYYYNVDELTNEELKIYKSTYELKDYTGYLPYIILTSNDKLITTIKDTIDIDSIKNILKQNKIVGF